MTSATPGARSKSLVEGAGGVRGSQMRQAGVICECARECQCRCRGTSVCFTRSRVAALLVLVSLNDNDVAVTPVAPRTCAVQCCLTVTSMTRCRLLVTGRCDVCCVCKYMYSSFSSAITVKLPVILVSAHALLLVSSARPSSQQPAPVQQQTAGVRLKLDLACDLYAAARVNELNMLLV